MSGNAAGSVAPVELVPTLCALCHADDATPVLVGRDLRRAVPGRFQVVRCRCGLVYTNPRPTPAGIALYYPEDYSPHRLGPPGTAEAAYYRLFRMPPVPAPARVLDVGCGGGHYLLFLRERGYEVAGVEPSERVARELAEAHGLEIHAGLLTEAGLEAERFDVVTLWWVIEHTHDPLEQLREARRLLRPGGSVIVATQNFASFGRRVFGAHWHHLDLPGHLYHFDPSTLRRALEAADLRVDRIRQDPIAKDFAPSLGHRLGRGLDGALPNALALPADLLGWLARRSGLITAYATRQ